MTWALYWLAWMGAIGGPVALFLVARDARRRRAGRWSMARRAITAAGAAVWMLSVWAFLIEPAQLTVRTVTVASAQWRGPPLRIGLISDTHVGGPHVDPARIARVVERMNAARPDLVVLLGDYVGGHKAAAAHTPAYRRAVAEGIAAFGGLAAPLGVVAVHGNHDWWYDGPATERAMRDAGVAMLENDALRVARGEDAFWLIGLAEETSERSQPDFAAALRTVPPDADVIALAHRPDVFFNAPGRVALTLAGHSHCGQVNLPLAGRLMHASAGAARWPCGAYDEGGRKLYVTGGVGVSILPVRFNQPPEIVLLTLTAD
ncbi:MAG: metallophosphoesterase [Hyphomonadaceae bacterium]|nr:metallophosphoesterase [Hyphomonadaceae bacterium]